MKHFVGIMCGFLVFTSSWSAYSKSYMPSLERLRNKVENALKDREKIPLKDLFDKAKDQGIEPHAGGVVVLTADGVLTDRKPDELFQKLENIARRIEALYWCHRPDLVDPNQQEDIKNLLKQSLRDHRKVDVPSIIDFAKELAEEAAMLNECSNQCVMLMFARNNDVDQKVIISKSQELFDHIAEKKSRLDRLINLVNTLFFAF